jgi:hypothetical protein
VAVSLGVVSHFMKASYIKKSSETATSCAPPPFANEAERGERRLMGRPANP